MSQGFPVEPRLSYGQACCSFAKSHGAGGECDRDFARTAQIGQAGNAMNCMVCCIVMLYAITQVKKEELTIVSGGFESLLKRLGATVLGGHRS